MLISLHTFDITISDFFVSPGGFEPHILKSVAWCSIRWTIETICGQDRSRTCNTLFIIVILEMLSHLGSASTIPPPDHFWETRELHHQNRFPHNILILGITPHFTSIEFFGYTSKFCNFCILLMGVLFWSSTPHPNTLEIQTLTKLLGNLLNKSPCSVSFCLCLHS